MTTVVRKGTNRPAAKARREKAAQRTPLPPKADSATKGLQDLLPKTRKPAKKAATPAPKATKKAAAPRAVKKAAAKPTATSQWPKVNALIETASTNGWATTFSEKGETSEVVAKSPDGQQITAWFRRGCADPENYPLWEMGGRIVKLKNMSDCRRHMSGDHRVQMSVKTGPTAPRRKRVGRNISDDRPRVPFDPAVTPDPEILSAVLGRLIKWRNQVSQAVESARILPLHYCPLHYRAVEPGTLCPAEKCGRRPVKQRGLRLGTQGRREMRILTFNAAGEGTRSVYLDRIIEVK